jgi:hypothetical protein
VSKPVRIQRKRTKGWKMPPNTVYVGRPTRWGNPFDWSEARDEFGCSEVEAKQWAKQTYCEMCTLVLGDNPNRFTSIEGCEEQQRFIKTNLSSLAGKNLACFCKLDQSCHADVLLELANSEGAGA